MKKNIILPLLFILSTSIYSQITFKKGYYIDNSNKKTECYIKDFDWLNNPSEIFYKLSQEDNVNQININFIKEFQLNNISKYIRKTVKIDRSSNGTNDLNNLRRPIFKEETIFLKIIIEGKASLFKYSDGDLQRFFFSTEESNLEQLIFKKYIFKNKVATNNRFKQQLLNTLKCSSVKKNRLQNLRYTKNDLTSVFVQYNKCTNSNFVNFEEKKENRKAFNFNLRPRVNFSSLTIENPRPTYYGYSNETNFTSKTNFGFGVELEYILPFNKNKWALTVEPTYQNYNSEGSINATYIYGNKLISKIEYNSIEIPVSLRHYFFFNNTSKIFTNISYVFNINSKSEIVQGRANGSNLDEFNINSSNGIAVGIGYKLKDKYSIEARLITNRDLLSEYETLDSNYQTLSIIFGYTIF